MEHMQALRAASEQIAALGEKLDATAVDRVASELRRTVSAAALSRWSAELPRSLNSTYLRAVLNGSAADWTAFFHLQSEREPLHLLAFARALAAEDQFDEAALQLRRALEQRPGYTFYTRAEKAVRAIAAKTSAHLRECRVAVLGASTTSLLLPVLEAVFLRDRIRAEIYEGLYGAAQQEILDPASGLARFRPQIVFLATHWRELQLPAVVDNEAEFLERYVAERKTLWERLSSQFGCHVVQFAFDFPAEEPYGYLSSSLRGGRSRLLQLLNLRMMEEAPSWVSILDTPALQRDTHGARWQNDMLWHSFQQHPSTEALPLVADLMAAHTRAVLGLTRKVLVTDLDNTLWKGVIGEDGLEGIRIGPGSPAGEAHARLQSYMLDLKARGILLAAASKNNHEDAALPFLKHPHMLLRMEDFAAFEANWNDKASSIAEVARKLSLGLDSLVFLDDNPIEREWVRSQLPDVAVVEPGTSVFQYVHNLDRARLFHAVSLSAEDQSRAEGYRSEAARKHLQATSQSLEDFLANLQLRASVEPVSAANLARVTQLTNKTNQFNLTTRRYTEAQVQQLASDASAWTAAFRLSDRLGEYGLIGVMFCRGAGPAVWEVDTWLMSCRVLGRQMEKFMFDRLIEAARSRGIREIAGVYRATAKNGLVRDLYGQLGFERTAQSDAETRYRLYVPESSVRTALHVAEDTALACAV